MAILISGSPVNCTPLPSPCSPAPYSKLTVLVCQRIFEYNVYSLVVYQVAIGDNNMEVSSSKFQYFGETLFLTNLK